jgi:predicted transglutaminase-like cysteine proteinase
MAVTYNKDVSSFKKWIPVKTWLLKQPAVTTPVYGLPAVCDQVNRAVNTQFVYQRDGLNDMWFTPEQFVKGHGGDCEDFSIYKMHRLAQAGVPLSKMELVICTDMRSREYHCVLRVFSGNYQYVLDNQTIGLLTKDTFIARYAPIYAINVSGWRVCGN